MTRKTRLQKLDLDEDFFRGLNTHQALKEAFVRIHIDQAFMDPHFPTIPCVGAFAARTLSGWNPKPLRRQWNWSAKLHTCPVGDLHDLAADAVQALWIGA